MNTLDKTFDLYMSDYEDAECGTASRGGEFVITDSAAHQAALEAESKLALEREEAKQSWALFHDTVLN